MDSLFKISQNLKKFGFNNASPPDIKTSLVSNFFKVKSRFDTSSSVSCFKLLFPFQMSHMMQRQLHALCGMRITMGNAVMTCDCKLRYLFKV